MCEVVSRNTRYVQNDPFAICCLLAPLPPVERILSPIVHSSFSHHSKTDTEIHTVHGIFIYDTSLILEILKTLDSHCEAAVELAGNP